MPFSPPREEEGLTSFSLDAAKRETSHAVPPPKVTTTPMRWYAPGQPVKVCGISILGGMVYAGVPEFFAPPDPAFIDITLPVAGQYVAPSHRLGGYWPSYDKLTPMARRAYLHWLAGGRRDPLADIGYVFLFLYGIEYRCLHEKPTTADLQGITNELHRLLYTYGSNRSFQSYASQLLKVLTSKVVSVPNPTRPTVEQLTQSWLTPMPRDLKEALATHALQETPMPAGLALSWVLSRREAAPHLKFIFSKTYARLFTVRYEETFGTGVIPAYRLARNSITYTPASAGFNGKTFTWDLGERPNVYELGVSNSKLQTLADQTTDELRAFYRFMAGRPLPRQTRSWGGYDIYEMSRERPPDCLEAIGLLPYAAWSADLQSRWTAFREHIQPTPKTLAVSNLAQFLGVEPDLTQAGLSALQALCPEEELHLAPGARQGKGIAADALLVLYRRTPGEAPLEASEQLSAMEALIDLAFWVATELGQLTPARRQRLMNDLLAWPGLSSTERTWLNGYADLQPMPSTTTLAKLKNRFKGLGSAGSISARYMAQLAHADGAPSLDEIKVLERVYKALGVPAQDLYGDLNEPTARKVAVAATPGAASNGVTLDSARIAQLQAETAAVAKLLGGVFEAEPEPEPVPVTEASPPDNVAQPATMAAANIWTLDSKHSAFVRVLLTQDCWGRAALLELASQQGLMLDGALEAINEAALDNCDMPLTEGDDPVEINEDLRREIA